MNMQKHSEDILALDSPVYSHMRIIRMFGKKKESKFTVVTIEKMSQRGLSFRSFLRLPINENVVWSFQIRLGESYLVVEGVILNAKLTQQGYAYEMQWNMSEENSEQLDQLAVRLPQMIKLYNKAARSYNLYSNDKASRKQIDLLC
ncbi:hypothetical protein GK047_14135 [Paenibacillus sp. SYP-B3998]|uniref:PilZ domain-containing protein n=1 Tax=Paenibacillus sp. SYP-B3998 TaxID=2678564 RepID=A0A6G3ZY52_9BACL|nr:hypothetical protein [Paenibacillus sp. SYP-B3998]NEW07143.1 hypothetical protein [Paenibacillus sp. SYP-B3998]